MSYGYDAASNRTSFTDPQSGGTNYVYDTLNRLQTLTNPQSQQFTFCYDALSRRTSLTRPNNVTTSYSYDSLSRLLSVLHKDSTNALLDGATYTVDNVGNRMSKTNERTTVPESYTYDPIYQLQQVQQTVSGTPSTTETYAYDPVGNRTSSLNIASYSVNSSNQLTSTTNGTYTYDNHGNTLTDSAKSATYTWDLENRLSQVSFTGGGTVDYKYDPFGRRIYRSGPSGTTIWLYEGANIVEELDGTGTLQATYTQGSGVDEPLAMLRGATTDYYEADGLGSVTSLTDSTGTVAETYTYDAYGNLTAGGATLNNPFRYTGREWDQDAGLYYYRARYYDPAIGRFISEDPIRFASGTTNFYAYVGDDPINYIDPFGLARDCGKPKCFAQLKYRPVQDWRAKMFSRNHAFWYVQGSTGIQYILSGGPNPPNGGNQHLNVWPNQDIHGGVDNVSATVWWDSGLSAENCKGVDAMIAAANGWPQDTIPYHPVEGPNSDTAAHSLGTSGGFNFPAPPGMTGWNTPLPPTPPH